MLKKLWQSIMSLTTKEILCFLTNRNGTHLFRPATITYCQTLYLSASLEQNYEMKTTWEVKCSNSLVNYWCLCFLNSPWSLKGRVSRHVCNSTQVSERDHRYDASGLNGWNVSIKHAFPNVNISSYKDVRTRHHFYRLSVTGILHSAEDGFAWKEQLGSINLWLSWRGGSMHIITSSIDVLIIVLVLF